MIKIMKRGEVSESELFARKVSGADVAGTVAEIIADVRENGDAALRKKKGMRMTRRRLPGFWTRRESWMWTETGFGSGTGKISPCAW